jgi:hypothetical protein
LFTDKKSQRSHKTVGIKVFLLFLLDERIRIWEAQKPTEPDLEYWIEVISAANKYASLCSAVAAVLAGGLAAGKYKCSFGSDSLECRRIFT